MIERTMLYVETMNGLIPYVSSPQFTVRSVSQNSSVPCDDNTITISLQMDQNILKCSTDAELIISSLEVDLPAQPAIVSSSSYIANSGLWNSMTRSLTVSITESWTASQTLVFSVSTVNPHYPQSNVSQPMVTIKDYTAFPTALQSPDGIYPTSVAIPGIVLSNIVQSTSIPGAQNMLTVTLMSNLTISNKCGTILTISGLSGICPSSVIDLSGNGSSIFGGKAHWMNASNAVTMTISESMMANVIYQISFTVLNPSTPQPSPRILLQYFLYQPITQNMTKVMTSAGAALEITGNLKFNVATVTQTEAAAGSTNKITFTFQTNVPLYSMASLTISGLKSDHALESVQYQAPLNGEFNSQAGLLVLNISSSLSEGVNYTVSFNMVNPRQARLPQRVFIESGGVILPKVEMTPATGDLAPFVVLPPYFNTSSASQNVHNSSTKPGQLNSLSLSFSASVKLIANESVWFSVTNLHGVKLASQVADSVSGPSMDKFSKWIWNSTNSTLSFQLGQDLNAFEVLDFSLQLTNGVYGQDGQQLYLQVFSYGSGVFIPYTPLQSDPNLLLIESSVSFLEKSIGQSSWLPGATNTLSVTLKPEFPLKQGDSVTVHGLLGFQRNDGILTLLNAGPGFEPNATWSRSAGRVILTVAENSEISNTTEVSFDLQNPLYPHACLENIQISATSNVPYLKAPMSTGPDKSCPLYIVAAGFSNLSISSSSIVADTTNDVSIMFQTNMNIFAYSSTTISVQGLIGTATPSQDFIPVTVDPVSLGKDFAPQAELIEVGFAPSCTLSNQQVVLTNLNGNGTLKGANMYFTCQKQTPIQISAYDWASKCANLSSLPSCTLGQVEYVTVVDGGLGYLSGPFEVASGSQVSGLSGNCTVNTAGAITGIVIITKGQGFSPGDKIVCPGNNITRPAVFQYTTSNDTASVSAAKWNQDFGRLELNYLGEALEESMQYKFSVSLLNGIRPQAAQTASISIQSPVPFGTQTFQQKAMEILQFASVYTRASTAAPNTAESTQVLFKGMQCQQSSVYLISADVQCNTPISTLSLMMNGETTTVNNPLQSCSTYCTQYARVVDRKQYSYGSLNLDTAAFYGILNTTQASESMVDVCGNKERLKIIFTLEC
uniref:IPT/TIG domain-containing protein n=1 Tax=Guillardia theta TaxID=55529 RepID=A0A6U5VWA8_GUITH